MSLRTFHLVFITMSCLMCFGMGAWGIHRHLSVANSTHLILGILGFVFAAGLMAYEVWFLGKQGPLNEPTSPKG